MDVIRKLLSPSDIVPADIRYNDTDDVVQTFDGTDWIDSPDRDPRRIDAFDAPTGANPHCIGAARMSAFLQSIVTDIVTGLDDGKNDAQMALIVLGALALIPGIDLLFILVSVLVGALILAGASFMHDAFDEFDWSALTCLISQYVRSDGFIDDTGFSALEAAITDTFDTDPASVLNDILHITGRGGLNDAAALRTETGDCDCGLGLAWEWDFSDGTYSGWFPLYANGHYNGVDAGLYFQSVYYSGGAGEYALRMVHTSLPMSTFTRMEIEYDATAEVTWYFYEQCPGANLVTTATLPAGTRQIATIEAYDATTCGFRIDVATSGANTFRVRKVRVWFTGSTYPAFAEGHEYQ